MSIFKRKEKKNKNNFDNNGSINREDTMVKTLSENQVQEMDDFVAVNFPNCPFPVFDKYDRTLEATFENLKKHLGLQYDDIELKRGDMWVHGGTHAGFFQPLSASKGTITINRGLSYEEERAVLIHEITHAFLHINDVHYSEVEKKEEIFTDMFCFYLGLSDRVIQNRGSNNRLHLGYVNYSDFNTLKNVYYARKKSKDTILVEINVYDTLVKEVLINIEKMLQFYLPEDDKKYLIRIKEKYNMKEFKSIIHKMLLDYNKCKKATIDKNIDIVNNLKRELFEERTKIESIYEFLHIKREKQTEN